MRTAEDEGIDEIGVVLGEELSEVLFDDEARGERIAPAFFDEWDEKGAGESVNVDVWVEAMDGAFVGLAVDGRARTDECDMVRARHLYGEEGGGFNDAVNGNIELSAECVDGVGACGIACDDERFNAAIRQFFCACQGVSNDGLRRAVAVGNARGVAEVEIVLVG